MSKGKWALALGLGAVVGAVASTLAHLKFKERIVQLAEDALAQAEELSQVLNAGKSQGGGTDAG